MARMNIGGRSYDIDLVVFDKDGLLFDAGHFWNCLAEARMQQLSLLTRDETVKAWCQSFGVVEKDGQVTHVDPNGILALASVQEEMIATATILKTYESWDWEQCRSKANVIFDQSDKHFDLLSALQPKTGFPDIFLRLQKLGIPYGIATSDDKDRTVTSINHFDAVSNLSFLITPADVKRGKPHPDMLFRAAELTGAKLERMVMIGDSFIDMQMARKAGCIGIGIPDHADMREKMKPFADVIVESLDQIMFENAPL